MGLLVMSTARLKEKQERLRQLAREQAKISQPTSGTGGLRVILDPSVGKDVVSLRSFEPDEFICIYPGERIFSRSETIRRDQEYKEKGEGCYILEAVNSRGKYIAFDATDHKYYKFFGRFMNHSDEPNVRVCLEYNEDKEIVAVFRALRYIKAEESLRYHYGDTAKNRPDWIEKQKFTVEETRTFWKTNC